MKLRISMQELDEIIKFLKYEGPVFLLTRVDFVNELERLEKN